MKITKEISFSQFEPWSGAVDTYNLIAEAGKGDAFESLVEDLYPDGLSDTELNDLLWFDSDWLLDSLGITEEDDDEDEEDEEEEEEEEDTTEE